MKKQEIIYVLESKSNHHDWRPGHELAVGFDGKVIAFTSKASAKKSLEQNSDFSGIGGDILRRSGQKYRIAKWGRLQPKRIVQKRAKKGGRKA